MIRIEHVTRKFGRFTAVDNVSLSLAAGDSVALWGANGAGKTTLIRCALGLLRYRGRITIGGHDLRRCGKHARLLIGYVPQELGFYDELRLSEAVTFFSRLKGLRSPDTRATLDTVGLGDHHAKRVRELSGGMKQRLALAIALLGDPPILLLDEVTASLDAVGRKEFVGLLEQLSGSGRTMLFASHRIDEVAALASRVAILDRGRIVRELATSAFVQEQDHGLVLHITMPATSRPSAMQSLHDGGFNPRLNGMGVLVPVAPEQKATPFRILGEARIPYDDFELVTAASLASHLEKQQ